MKPIKLTMQAFGPFAKTETIEFEKLGDNPLFLINGPTGSGKTSILDAISFALYGETTSNERLGIQMRCDMAEPSLVTEVSLEFALHNKVYRVTRSPEQEVPKARGEGTTIRKHTAALYDITGEDSSTDEVALVTSKTSQVRVEVTNIIGLNETQFRQVMVLPQGKFRELLLATSKEREEIFGQLFQTDIYKKIEYALKDKASAISKEKNEFDNQIRGALQIADVVSEAELNEQHVSLSSQFTTVQKQEQDVLAQLNLVKAELQKADALSQDFKKREQAQLDLNNHLQGSEANKTRQQQLERAAHAIKLELPYSNLQNEVKHSDDLAKKVGALTETLKAAEAAEKSEESKLQLAKEHVAQVPQLTKNLHSLESMKGQLAEKAACEKTITDGIKQKAANDAMLSKYLAFRDQLALKAQQDQQALEKARLELASVPAIQADIQQKQRLAQDLERLNGIQQETANLVALTAPKQAAVNQAQVNYQNQHRNADTLEMNWHNAQAAVLAQRLNYGEACPVCGSAEHPMPAQFVGEQVTKEQVQYARNQAQEAQSVLNGLVSELEQHNMQLGQYQQQSAQLVNELGENAAIAIHELQASIAQLHGQLEQLKLVDVNKQSADLEDLNKRCIDGENIINELRTQMAANDSTLQANQAQLDKITHTLDPKFADLAALEKEMVQLQQQVEHLNKGFELAQQTLQQALVAKSQAAKELSTHQQLAQTANEKATQLNNEWQQALQASAFESEAHYLESKVTEQEMKLWQQALESFKQKQTQLEQTVADLEQSLKEKEKPDLTALNEKLTKTQQSYNEARGQLDSARSLFERIEKVKSDIATLHEKNEQLEEAYKVFGTLYDVASGKTGSRVSLHRFVLGVLLDDVLIQSSQRLSVMSKGRYILARKTEGFKGAAGRGLDLVVEDSYTGKTRDVATLSGGESFMAALALALGLSDVVQSYSGGIRLDTLFIDEGFGSLDPESLDLAIQTLVDLQQTGRMIGVISHVSELKDQMKQRIDVCSSRTGSTISVKSPLVYDA